MDAGLWIYIALFVMLILCSAFFSGSESAYFSLDQAHIRRLRGEKNQTVKIKRTLQLLANSRRLLMCILVGNTVVNVAAATVAAIFTARFFSEDASVSGFGMLVQIVIVTFVILVFSEVSPKVFAVKKARQFALFVSLPLFIVVNLLTPVSYVLEKLTYGFSRIFRINKEIDFKNEDELKTLIEVGEEKGTLDPDEREMIHSIFEFGETMVKEIMIPRMDMIGIEKSAPIEDVLKLIKGKGHSRIPVYDENIDNILGILFVKDLLRYMYGNENVPELKELVHKAYFIPESKMIDDLLKEFQKERNHMAIVVDEYGGTAGLITLEDVIEEIVGEIRDEYDREKPLVRKVNDHSWRVDGKINIDDLNEKLGLDIPSEEDYESLGGFIFSLMGRIPNDKEDVRYGDLHLIVEKVFDRRIKTVLIKKDNAKNRDETL